MNTSVRKIKLDLPPTANLVAAPLWQVVNPANGHSIQAPVEICGDGVRLWHERARSIGLQPGDPVDLTPP